MRGWVARKIRLKIMVLPKFKATTTTTTHKTIMTIMTTIMTSITTSFMINTMVSTMTSVRINIMISTITSVKISNMVSIMTSVRINTMTNSSMIHTLRIIMNNRSTTTNTTITMSSLSLEVLSRYPRIQSPLLASLFDLKSVNILRLEKGRNRSTRNGLPIRLHRNRNRSISLSPN